MYNNNRKKGKQIIIKKRQFTYVCNVQSSKSFLAEHRHLQINESREKIIKSVMKQAEIVFPFCLKHNIG